jgi:hypothetical protein
MRRITSVIGLALVICALTATAFFARCAGHLPGLRLPLVGGQHARELEQ